MGKAPMIIHHGGMISGKTLAIIISAQQKDAIGELVLPFVPSNNKAGSYMATRFKSQDPLKFSSLERILQLTEGNGTEKKDEEKTEPAGKVVPPQLPDPNCIENQIMIPAIPVQHSDEIFQYVVKHVQDCYDVSYARGFTIGRYRTSVLIDEIQLLDSGIMRVVDDLTYNGITVVGSIVDLDFTGRPFKLSGKEHVTAPDLISIATKQIQHHALCAELSDGFPCGRLATRSQRYRDEEHTNPSHYDDNPIEVNPRLYVPVCEGHHRVPGKNRTLISRR